MRENLSSLTALSDESEFERADATNLKMTSYGIDDATSIANQPRR